MNYKKEKNENYTLHLINTDRFKEIYISIRFTKPFEKETGAYLKLLERVLLSNGTKKYKTRKSLSRKFEYLYNTNIVNTFYAVSKNMVFESKLMLVNPKYTDSSVYTESIKLLKEVLINPNIKNNEWNNEVFEIEKDNLIKSIENVKDNPENYGKLKFEESFFKGTVFAENNYKNLKIFKSLENKKLYEVYKSLFNDFKIDVMVIGDFEEEIIKKELNKLLKDFTQNDKTIKNNQIKLTHKSIIEKKEKINYNQSNLFVGCLVDDITEEERNFILILYNTILGSMNNSVLFVNVREKHSLCYHIGSIINKFTDTIVIDSGINAKNYDLTLKLIKESIESMTECSVIKKLITNAQKTLEIAFNDFYDNIYKIMDYYYLNEFTYIPSIQERKEKVEKCGVDEICTLAKKIKISNIFLLEGELYEEN